MEAHVSESKGDELAEAMTLNVESPWVTPEVLSFCLIMENDGGILSTHTMGMQGLGNQRIANRATHRLLEKGYVERTLIGHFRRYTVTSAGKDAAAELQHAIEQCLEGSHVSVRDVVQTEAWQLLNQHARVALVLTSARGRPVGVKDVAELVGVSRNVVNRTLNVLKEANHIQTLPLSLEGVQYETSAQCTKSLHTLLQRLRHAREMMVVREQEHASLPNEVLRVLMDISAPFFNRGDARGKRAHDILAPRAKQHLATLFDIGLAAVQHDDGGDIWWSATSDGLRIAETYRDLARHVSEAAAAAAAAKR